MAGPLVVVQVLNGRLISGAVSDPLEEAMALILLGSRKIAGTARGSRQVREELAHQPVLARV